ncbi:unnamed protein product [Vicia faba]|uniref:Uncharacterized protein n=1 Tax=Vicia faba TaxID=3906 RepID=A0AAV1B0V6_VICFA|nr:unnamed protein product [Vicia faba]
MEIKLESYNLDIEIDQGTVGTSQQAESGFPDAFDISLSHFTLVLALENESGGIQEIALEVDIRLIFNLRTTGMNESQSNKNNSSVKDVAVTDVSSPYFPSKIIRENSVDSLQITKQYPSYSSFQN